jgi:hypothetical protein
MGVALLATVTQVTTAYKSSQRLRARMGSNIATVPASTSSVVLAKLTRIGSMTTDDRASLVPMAFSSTCLSTIQVEGARNLVKSLEEKTCWRTGELVLLGQVGN